MRRSRRLVPAGEAPLAALRGDNDGHDDVVVDDVIAAVLGVHENLGRPSVVQNLPKAWCERKTFSRPERTKERVSLQSRYD
jgi:hypothetical protein